VSCALSAVDSTVPARWVADVPVELGRDEARELAIRELANPAYDADPPLLQRVVEWIIDRIQELIGRTAGALDGAVGIAVLLAVLTLVIIVIVMRMGPLARRRTRSEPLFPAGRRTAAEYRAAADAAAASEDWSTAVVERYRAIVVAFEERGLLDPRPGRTADEAAAEAGAVLPDLVSDLTAGSILFDSVRYGGREATAADDARMRRLDDDALGTRPGGPGLPLGVLDPAVPR
jgi:Domain of unknown function (DUF4129)